MSALGYAALGGLVVFLLQLARAEWKRKGASILNWIERVNAACSKVKFFEIKVECVEAQLRTLDAPLKDFDRRLARIEGELFDDCPRVKRNHDAE